MTYIRLPGRNAQSRHRTCLYFIREKSEPFSVFLDVPFDEKEKHLLLALLLATILGFGITSPNVIAVNAAETTAQQYDTRYLENYLKSILPKDKTTLLVDNGTGISGTLESEV